MEEHDKGPLLDLVVVASQQCMEYCEIAAYGSMVELSKAIGHGESADLLAETLAEEKAQDERLTAVTRSSLLTAAMQMAGETEDDDAEGQPQRSTEPLQEELAVLFAGDTVSTRRS